MIYVPHNSFSFGWLSLLVLLSSIVGIINSGALTFPSHFPHIPYNATAKSTINQIVNSYFLPHATVSASSLRSRDLNLEARQFQNEMENLISFQVCNFVHLNVAVWWGNKGLVVC
jgi:hypothetical protein